MSDAFTYLRETRSPYGATLRSEREQLARDIARDQALLSDDRTPAAIKDNLRLGHRTRLIEIEGIEKQLSAKQRSNPNY